MSINYNPTIVQSGLVLYMDSMNRKSYSGSGTTWSDLVGGNIATLTNPVYNADKSLAFNGTNAYATIPNNTKLDTQAPTVEVWMKTNALSQNGFWFEKGSVNTEYSLFQEGGNIVWRQGGISQYTTTASYLNTTQYFQIVGTYVSGSRNTYINGNLVTTDTATGAVGVNGSGMTIGMYNSGGYLFNGNIAVVRVYSRVLTASEVYQNFISCRGRFGL